MRKATILLADDNEALLEAITGLLQPVFEIVGVVHDGFALVDSALHLQPDVVVVDISMPLLNGIEAARRLKAAGSTATIVFLTVHDDPDFVRAARALGNVGYIIKQHMALDLIPAIEQVLTGRSFVSPCLAEQR